MGGGVLYINSSVHISSYTHTGHVMHAQERSKCGFLNVHLANSVHTRQAETGFCFFFYCDFFFLLFIIYRRGFVGNVKVVQILL